MAGVVGGAFLSSALNVLFDRLASEEVINFFRGRKHEERLLNDLNLKLIEVNKVLNDAEYKQITDPDVKRWLDELKEAVYRADDLVDEIAYKALRCKVEAECQSGSNQVQSLISTFTSLFDRGMASELENMIAKFDNFVKAKDVLGLTEVVGQSWSQTRSPTTSLVDETRVYGRDTDKEEIMKLLLSDGENCNKIDVIPIVGMGGIGKTTLAQLLYKDGRLVGRFDNRAWVCVSDVFDVLRVTKTIVEAVTGITCGTNDLNLLHVKLEESLKGKKFLIVLDDVWNENEDYWDILMTPLRCGAHGSKIIVTTRNESVVSTIHTVPIRGLQELAEKDCWMIFSKCAFENEDFNAHPDLEKTGKEIVKKCKGLPLALKAMGCLLRSKRDVESWNSILKSGIWDLPNNNILPALRLSYHYLPSHLKRCFAYCSIFVKDYEFDMKELVSTWIAEGFLEKPKNSKTVEEKGYECFHELLSRSFFQRSNVNNSYFVMHDLVHDLAQFVIGDFLYRLEDAKSHGISEKVRHFSYVRSDWNGLDSFNSVDGFDKLNKIKEAKYLRTFLALKYGSKVKQRGWLSKKVMDEILPRLTCLRLVSLANYGIMELPHSIGNLIHLRFLDLSYTLISQLPESVCTLYNLETLLLSNCHLLTTLPAALGQLILLRQLDISGTNLKEMPMHMSTLKDLVQLTAFFVGRNSGSSINELKEFDNLCGTISISGLQNVASGSDAMEARIGQKMRLETLALEWVGTTDDSENERDVLEKLQPHTNLKHLNIKNYGSPIFPAWLGDQLFCNMVSLRLDNCENCISLPPLGQLSSLKELSISRMSGLREVGHGFYGKSGFLSKPFDSLETLRFEEMLVWVDWRIMDAGEFSQLQKLEVINCPKLTGELPKKVPSLVRLEIRGCPELVASLPRTTLIREIVLDRCQEVRLEWQSVSHVEKLQISGFSNLEEFPRELVTLRNLQVLSVVGCPELLSFPEGMMRVSDLKRLAVWSCPKLVLPLSLEMSHFYTSLEWLTLSGCWSLKSLPLDLFPKLSFLEIRNCKKFETLLIPDGIELQNLRRLFISRCNKMVSFPCRELPAPNMSCLYVENCKKLKALPEQMHTLLPSLGMLYLRNCPEIESFPEGGLPSKLNSILIQNCKKLAGGRRDWGLQTLPSLADFFLGGESEDVVESFPEEGLLPSTLTRLTIVNMPNLKSLNKRGLQLLGSLESIEIGNCHQLQFLPEEGLPTSLVMLDIEGCPLLKSRYRSEEGEEWRKIAHVPVINMDGEAFIDQVYLGPAGRHGFPNIWGVDYVSPPRYLCCAEKTLFLPPAETNVSFKSITAVGVIVYSM